MRSGSIPPCRRSLPRANCDALAIAAGQSRSGTAARRRRARSRQAVVDLRQALRRRALGVQSRARRVAGNAARACGAARSIACGTDSAPVEMTRMAVVLMNLGGPDSLEAVRAVSVQSVQRSGDHRSAVAAANAACAADRAAAALERRARSMPSSAGHRRCWLIPRRRRGLWNAVLGSDYRCLSRCAIGIRRAQRRRAQSRLGRPDEIVCLPLYPQFSTTTTASSLAAWRQQPRRGRALIARPESSAATPIENGFIEALAGLDPPGA